ncbi:MAG: 50S ribosomal protein L9 [Candidatus Omnitrophica bacterium]|nr:50S ribosomal protein L9 [Candidatus Omnitrophota bacterium]
MKVILLKDLKRAGKSGQVIEVKDGYGRNYLIPYGFALVVTKENFKRLEQIQEKERKLLEKKKEEALKLRQRVENVSLTITAHLKENGEIYGTIGEGQIAKALKNEEGINIDKEKISLLDPIKELGVYKVDVELYPEVIASLRVWVVKK